MSPDLPATAPTEDDGDGATRPAWSRARRRPAITAGRRPDRPPLSFAQLRLWFLDQLVPGSAFYNVHGAVWLEFVVDVVALRGALQGVVDRHEMLRTTFADLDGEPVQVIAPSWRVELSVVSLRGVGVEEREGEAQRLATVEAQRPFDLRRGPLLRCGLIEVDVDRWLFVVTLHHIVADGWSMGVFFREVGALYRAAVTGSDAGLGPLGVQYADFAVWQRETLDGHGFDGQLAYWREQLAGLGTCELVGDRVRPLRPTFAGARLEVGLDARLTARLRVLAERHNATLFMVLLAGFVVVLQRHGVGDDVAVGVPVAGRDRAEIEPLIGFFVNTLVVRADLGGEPSFDEVIERVRATTLDALTHQDIPFERLVEELHPDRALNRNPLCQIMFQLQTTETAGGGAARERAMRVDKQTANFDLAVDLFEGVDGVGGFVEFSTELYDGVTVERLVAHFRRLLDDASGDPSRPVWQLGLVDDDERRELVARGQGPRRARADVTVGELIAGHAQRRGGHPAVIEGDTTTSYGELVVLTAGLAAHLRVAGGGPGVVVGVYLPRGLAAVTALLAIWQCGATYLPLDPTYPSARIEHMLDDSGATLIVTTSEHAATLPTGHHTINLDTLPTTPPTATAPTPIRPDDPAYLIYTSGSTGHPKAVTITHRGLTNHALGIGEAYELDGSDVALAMASPSFDVSLEETIATMVAGGTVVVAPADRLTFDDVLEHGARHAATILNVPASMLSQWIRAPARHRRRLVPPSVRTVVVGSEAVAASTVAAWPSEVGHDATLINAYGPTEATVTATTWRAPAGEPVDAVHAPIGRPIANVDVVVVDDHDQLCPVGVPGELLIGGPGLATGYLNRPELTAAAFRVHPELPAGRYYHTGDLVRWRTDGTLEFLGRVDDQVKVRGHRIELGEIESVLRGHPAVTDAIAAVQQGPGGTDRIIAFVASDGRSVAAPAGSPGDPDAIVSGWQRLYDAVYEQPPAGPDRHFNHVGWIDVVTNAEIDAEAIREWLDEVVERVTEARPRRVLEIGCGTGMVVFAVSPHVDRYDATDVSAKAVAYVEANQPGDVDVLRVHQRPAHDFSGFVDESFDVVVLSSVVQYFPSLRYLLDVVVGASRVLVPGGRIYLGDLRNLRLAAAHATAAVLTRLSPDTPVDDVADEIERRLAAERELLVDPALFDWLPSLVPAITAVDVRLKHGAAANELNEFRYDAILHVGAPPPAAADVDELVWTEHGCSLDALGDLLADRSDGCVLRAIPNARVGQHLAAVSAVTARARHDAAGIRDEAAASAGAAASVDPAALCRAVERLGLVATCRWSSEPGRFDAVIHRVGTAPPDAAVRAVITTGALDELTTHPERAAALGELPAQLRTLAIGQLPEPFVPAKVHVLRSFPRLPNGKVDRATLARGRTTVRAVAAPQAPMDDVERLVAGVWGELFGVEHVGATDHFFADLGGHSLLGTMLIGRLRELMHVDVPLRWLFEEPTVAGLAARLRTDPCTADRTARVAELARRVAEMSDEDVARQLGGRS